jgi:hypothetical protein
MRRHKLLAFAEAKAVGTITSTVAEVRGPGRDVAVEARIAYGRLDPVDRHSLELSGYDRATFVGAVVALCESRTADLRWGFAERSAERRLGA